MKYLKYLTGGTYIVLGLIGIAATFMPHVDALFMIGGWFAFSAVIAYGVDMVIQATIPTKA